METKTAAPAPTSILPIGTIVAFALTSTEIPQGWLLCDGSTIPLQYQTLIICLKSPNTPNLCGRTLIGTGQGNSGTNYTLFDIGGEEKHQLTVQEMPSHTHQSPSNDSGNPAKNGSSVYGTDRPQDGVYPFTTGSSGGDQSHNNMQPYCAVNYIIYAGTR